MEQSEATGDVGDLMEKAYYDQHAIDVYRAMIREDVDDFEICCRSGYYSDEELDVIAQSCKRRVEKWSHNIDLLKTTSLSPDDIINDYPPVMFDT